MSRHYTATAQNVTVTSGLELFSLTMSTAYTLAILRRLIVSMVQPTIPAPQGLEIRLARYYGGTPGSGGSSMVPWSEDPGDAPSGSTLVVGNTIPLSGGTKTWEWDDGCYLYTGREIIFPYDIIIIYTNQLVVSLPNAPVGSPTPAVNAVLEWSEYGS